jgi:putative RNA 2'-phosphotransferase
VPASDRAQSISRRLALVLRHRPESIGLELDAHGWVAVDELLPALARHGLRLDRAELERVVATNDKQRFAFDAEHHRIRANQGHSLDVDLGLAPVTPPPILYHGTVQKFLPEIAADGLRPGTRRHVHLSQDVATARRVGSRRGSPIVLTVDAAAMVAADFIFFRSANGIWLTDHVPPRYLRLGRQPLTASLP